MDRIASCSGLIALIAGVFSGTGIVLYQIFGWLTDGIWQPVPLAAVASGLKSLASDWIGLQILFDWILRLPLSLLLLILGVLIFWRLGALSAKLYQKKVHGKGVTPSKCTPKLNRPSGSREIGRTAASVRTARQLRWETWQEIVSTVDEEPTKIRVSFGSALSRLKQGFNSPRERQPAKSMAYRTV